MDCWRERVKIEILDAFQANLPYDYEELESFAREIAESIPAPDERNGYKYVPANFKIEVDGPACPCCGFRLKTKERPPFVIGDEYLD